MRDIMDEAVESAYANLSVIAKYFYDKKFEKALKEAQMPYSALEYTSFAIALGIVSAIFSTLLIAVTELWFAFLPLAFAFAYTLAMLYPKQKAVHIRKAVEKEIPDFLRDVALELNAGSSFEKALLTYSKKGTVFSQLVRKAVLSIKHGGSVQEALGSLALMTSSKRLMRTVNALISVYEKTSKKQGDILQKLARDFSREDYARLKEYHSKVAVYSLIFITFSSVLPAMYQGFVAIASRFLSIGISPEQALLIPALLFPLLNILIIAIVREKAP
ncbi:hypothetical protein DRN74_00075 [Candidatus Micrarchaeota archaeon]|nr:MAG: hypothetical protein DRN74_00075 [Candidatus Micrarchaeota archaeon]